MINRASVQDLMKVKGYWHTMVNSDSDYPFQPELYKKMYKEVKSTKDRERFTEMVGLGTMTEANEYGDLNYDDINEGYNKNLMPLVYNLACLISREAWDDDQYKILNKYATAFKRSKVETLNTLAAVPFNTGFTVATSADGKYIFADDHILDGGGTYRNELSTPADLSVSSLRQALLDIWNTTDGRGKKLNIVPKYLYIPLALQFEAKEILKSANKPYTGNREINVMKDYDLEIITDLYLSDTDAWFLIAGDMNANYYPLKYVNRKEMETDLERIFDKSDAIKVRAYLRCIFGAIGWRGVFGTPGAA